MASEFTVENVVVCDDIRQEISHKHILVGVYSNVINIAMLPANINLAFWIELLCKKRGPLALQLKIELPGNPTGFHIGIDMTIDNTANSAPLATPQINCLITQEGEIKLFLRATGTEKWRLSKRVRVVYQSAINPQVNPFSSAPPPPS